MESIKPVTVISVKDTIELQKKGIDSAHEEYLKEVKALATDYAVRGLPENNALSIEPYIEQIRATGSRILNDNSLNLSASIRNQLGALDIFSLRQKIKDLRLRANAEAALLEKLKEAKGTFTGQRTLKEYEKLVRMLNIFTCIETGGYILSFVAIGDNFILASLWGIITSLLQTVGLKGLVLWLRDGAGVNLSMTTKRLIWGGVVLVATGLGLLRYATVQASGETGFAQSPLAPVIFILMSYFLISVLSVYIYHNYPTPEELANMKRAVALDDEIAIKEAELKTCLEQARQYTEDCNTIAQVHSLLIQASHDFYHRVNKGFLYAVGLFKSTNLISRTDNINPDCFSQPVLPLEMPNYDAWAETDLDVKPITETV